MSRNKRRYINTFNTESGSVNETVVTPEEETVVEEAIAPEEKEASEEIEKEVEESAPIEEEIVEEEKKEEPVVLKPDLTIPRMTTIYRVRLEWEKPDTQIYATMDLDLAKEEASKHEGYIVFNGETGEVVYDPWEEKEPEPKPIFKEVTSPSHYRPVVLTNTPVYRNAIDTKPFKYFSGKFYYFDNTVTNGRAKICTDPKYILRNQVAKILGYIDIKE